MNNLVITFLWWLVASGSASSLERGIDALQAFQVEEALQSLEQARTEGPYHHARHIKLYEQLGIAYAYLGREREALEAFDTLLVLSPGHALSYTLSPKVTFLFEKARNIAQQRPAPAIDMSWPRDLRLTDPVPVDIEVVADPKGFFHEADLYYRRKGQEAYLSTSFALPQPGQYRQIVLGPWEYESNTSETLQIYLSVRDAQDNQVLLLGTADRPREISLAFQEADPWYSQWWVWALLGGMLAAGTGAAVYLTTHDLPDTVGGTFQPAD